MGRYQPPQPTPLILAFDTATPCTSLALTRGGCKDGRIVASLSLTGQVSHSRRLLGAIDYLLSEAELSWDDIDGVACGLGPGSFTGLRIGLAAAKGLAHGAGKPLLGVSTLEVLAAQLVGPGLLCPVLDARKKEVYFSCYRFIDDEPDEQDSEPCGDEGNPELLEKNGSWKNPFYTCLVEPIVCPPEQCAQHLAELDRQVAGKTAAGSEPVIMIGDGATAYRPFFSEKLGKKICFASAQLNQVSAEALGLLGAEQLRRGWQLDIGAATPLYVRRSDAELNLIAKQDRLAKQNKKENEVNCSTEFCAGEGSNGTGRREAKR